MKLLSDVTFGMCYLHRFFPTHLALDSLMLLTLPRLKAYQKKHRRLLGIYNVEFHESYDYNDNDRHYNGEFGTNIEQQFRLYFKDIKNRINELENENENV